MRLRPGLCGSHVAATASFVWISEAGVASSPDADARWRVYLGDDGQLVVSATDLVGYLECRRLTHRDLMVARGQLGRPVLADEVLEVAIRRGVEHEVAYLDRLRSAGLSITEVAQRDGDDGLRAAEAETLDAMRSGVDVVYQATFFDGRWRGHADFLLKRTQRPSELGGWSYDVADTKLARRLKVPALLQMASYAEHLCRLQGVEPEYLTVVKGDGTSERYRLTYCAAYFRRVKDDLLAALGNGVGEAYPEPVPHCSICSWSADCTVRRRADDHLSLVAFMRRDHRRLLANAGFSTVGGLAEAPLDRLPTTVGETPRRRLWEQARLQVQERHTGIPTYSLLPTEVGRGLALLPEPSPGDVFFDIEGDPYIEDGGLEYLFGVLGPARRFTPYWAHDRIQEKAAFEAVIDSFMAAWDSDPGMHIYHYAPYEPSRVKALMGRHRTREAEVDRLLRGQRFVDLYTVVRQGLRVSRESYSIKALEAFYLTDARAGSAVSDAADSIIAYERWLQSGDPQELRDLERYNKLDCDSTRLLRSWLEERRAELIAHGNALGRPVHGDGRPGQVEQEAKTATDLLGQQLLTRASAHTDARSAEATHLLVNLLDWHRREARPGWWEYFARLDMSDEELAEDTTAIGLLDPPTCDGRQAQSLLWRHTFPPQDTKLGPGERRWINPRTSSGAGEVTAIDPVEGWVVLKRSVRSKKPHPTALVPGIPIDVRHHRANLLAIGQWVRDHSVDATGPHQAARDLLLREPPRLREPGTGSLQQPDEQPVDALRRLAGLLDHGILPVQGPPGTGKTWSGAHMVMELVAAGRTVGITALSHRAVANMLAQLACVAREHQLPVRILQKADQDNACHDPDVECVSDDHSVVDRLSTASVDVVGGSSWLFARPQMRDAVDTLVIDEAGQMSLANVAAISPAAANIVLLGDPQQLSQPAKGVHPPGAEVSALEYLLAGRATIPADLGLFLDQTHRMHPDLCRFVSDMVYDGRLRSHPSCANQQLDAGGGLAGTGLRWIPVTHEDNSAASTQEAQTVARLVKDLLGGTWTDREGARRPVTLDDVLVVAPYNAHVHRLRAHLPAGARVGTVDRFQGQQAAVVIYSLATSSAADAPRDLAFLFSLNRLNVALSRARCVAAVVASPRLLDAPVRTPEQLRLVNALCRFVEEAMTVERATDRQEVRSAGWPGRLLP